MFILSDIPEFIRKNLPYKVDLIDSGNRDVHRTRLNAAIEWCNREFGQMAFTAPLHKACLKEWQHDESARWDMVGESFRFRTQKDAAVFRVFWG